MAEWLAAGTTAATSSTRVTLADGVDCRVSLFTVGSGATSVPAQAYVVIISDEGGSNKDTVAATLTGALPNAVLRGPGEYYVMRPELTNLGVSTAVGVNSSTTPD